MHTGTMPCRFDFNALSLGELEKPLLAVYMFKELFGPGT